MVLSLRVYERALPQGAKEWQQKILGVIRLGSNVKEFIFGRNAETRGFLSGIDKYTFLDSMHGKFKMWATGNIYKFTDISKSGVALRTNLSLWIINFGPREAMLEKNDPTQIKVGDQLIMRDKTKRKEIILEVVQIY
ncbi:MAG: hypothetical protein Q8R18_04385 [bacterium]|nr:hypothetical protein [bacterium]